MERAERRVAAGSGGRSWLEAEIPRTPTSVHEALAALDAVTERLLARGDARAAFPDIYAIITRRVSESVGLGSPGFFQEPRWISRLAGRFCERYLETLRWSLHGDPQDTGAWGIAYACCELGDLMPLHHVLLGLSAHINYDLALGIAATIADHGGGDDPVLLARFKHDHDAVNCLLRASVPEAFDHLIERHGCPASRVIYRHAYAMAEWVVMQVLTTWRERVWNDAMALLRAPSATARRRIQRRLERRSRRYARLLAIPGILPGARGAPVGVGGSVDVQATMRAEQLLQALS
jgi:hypothetical protein